MQDKKPKKVDEDRNRLMGRRAGGTFKRTLTDREQTLYSLMQDSLWAKDRLKIMFEDLGPNIGGNYRAHYGPEEQDTLRLSTKAMQLGRETGEVLAHELVHSHQFAPEGRITSFLDLLRKDYRKYGEKPFVHTDTEMQAEAVTKALIAEAARDGVGPYAELGYGGASYLPGYIQRRDMEHQWIAREMLGRNIRPAERADRLFRRITGRDPR